MNEPPTKPFTKPSNEKYFKRIPATDGKPSRLVPKTDDELEIDVAIITEILHKHGIIPVSMQPPFYTEQQVESWPEYVQEEIQLRGKMLGTVLCERNIRKFPIVGNDNSEIYDSYQNYQKPNSVPKPTSTNNTPSPQSRTSDAVVILSYYQQEFADRPFCMGFVYFLALFGLPALFLFFGWTIFMFSQKGLWILMFASVVSILFIRACINSHANTIRSKNNQPPQY